MTDQQPLARPSAPWMLSLDAWLADWAGSDSSRAAVARTLSQIGQACRDIAHVVAQGPLAGALGDATGAANADGDAQTTLDVRANDLLRDALAQAPVAYFASEEEETIQTLAEDGAIAVAVDPLDGSSNIRVDVSVGTIFSLYPAKPGDPEGSLLRAGREQLAAGYVIYGPHTALVLTVGAGVDLFVLDPRDDTFKCVKQGLAIPPTTSEFAINASNYRFWATPVRAFVDDCLEGTEGPRQKNFNMRWIASMVADAHRIFTRGGVFLYPADSRPGYSKGRLRLLYEAAPIALLTEQAGGGATDGMEPILDLVPDQLHARIPLIFGSREKIDRIAKYHADPSLVQDVSPLFRERGLFRK
ncbi:class 1 fructose-bisphosphatase [Rhodothalassium salexigens]|uniref:class 1 fructose-bisphosphatase n=1 Tax=Rhodothalassium salexigens TaxID=1086 RepID=UPI001914733F|nr:class 1 fructose-bisphosphatase [Rhodothalassium salexigens]